MDKDSKKSIKDYLYRMFISFADSRESDTLADRLTEPVARDIEESADEEFNECDIDIALTRVLLDLTEDLS